MQKTKLLIVALGALFALPALAQEAAVAQHKEGVHVIPASAHTATTNIGLVSNYVWRGLTQTGDKPAIQGGFDYGHASGIYAGIWGSNISWVSDAGIATNASVELDAYFGFKSSFAEDFTYDIGYVRYMYPGTYNPGFAKVDTDEIYGAVGYKWVTAKYSYSLSDFFGTADSSGSSYIELNGSYTLEGPGVTLGAHYGEQTVSGAANSGLDYSDYSLKVSKDFSGYVLGALISETDISGDDTNYVFSVSRSF